MICNWNHNAFKFFWLIATLPIVNFNISTPVPQPDQAAEDLYGHKMRSVVEVILVKALCINAAAEHGGNHTRVTELPNPTHDKPAFHQSPLAFPAVYRRLSPCESRPYNCRSFEQFNPELVYPPPA